MKKAHGNSIEGRLELPGLTGMVWVVGWLFTIGYAQLSVAQTVFALFLWPWYPGSALT